MLVYLLKTFVLAIFGFLVAYFYYFSNSAHVENFDGYASYITIIGVIYGIYKYIQFEFSDSKAVFGLWKITGLFFGHLLVLCFLYFAYNNLSLSNGLVLFFKIIGFLIMPIIIVLSSLAFGKKITSYISYVKKQNYIYNFIFSFGIGFFSFVYLLDILGIFGLYNIYIVFSIIIGFIVFGFNELKSIFKSFNEYRIEIDIEEGNYFKLISSEFLFIISTLLLSINLISIVRPFPIGWDDLGVYMNYPHLMAQAGDIIALSGMYAWQTFTGIGYMFGAPTQAFFLNNVGGFMSFLFLVLITSDFLNHKYDSKLVGEQEVHKKSFINIPMLVGTLFIAMPMIVFQQAKDMKLDPGLFFVSIIVVYLLFKYYLSNDNKTYLESIKSFFGDKLLHKNYFINNLVIVLVIGILSGFAFTIKFTSLLLISAIFGVIFYVRLGIVGFLGYLSIYFAIFTKANLWQMMNVVVNPEKIPGFETKFFIIFSLIGLALLVYSFLKNKNIIKKFFLEFFVYLLGIIVALLPWIGKNISESYPDINLSRILTGKSESFTVDYTKIHTKEELQNIQNNIKTRSISEEGTTINEDYGRYFGYEKGVNNYIKLPWNLAMQVNQGGEFTDIGFLFLALLPVILLFLPLRNRYNSLFIVFLLIFELLVFIKTPNNLIENTKLSSFVSMSEEAKSAVFQRNGDVFKESIFSKDIYDINFNNYISYTDIQGYVSGENSFDEIEGKAKDAFYKELQTKISSDEEFTKNIALINKDLSDNDYKLLQELKVLNSKYSSFNQNITSLTDLKEIIKKNKLDNFSNQLIQLWKDNRTLNQSISDFFAAYKLPYGYSILLILYLIILVGLYYIVDDKSKENTKVKIYKMNLIFAGFYTFLWCISAFGIVWYGIVMYFSFLLFIGLGAYFLGVYIDESDEKKYYSKLLGSLVFFMIIIIYLVNSVIPHTFSNLKSAGYSEYKTGQLSTIDATYKYHQEYLKMLFYTNIDQSKKQEFFKEYITQDIQKVITGIENMDIYTIVSYLNQLPKQQEMFTNSSIVSLNNIYKNISDPNEKYRNKSGIYRVGTFLKYHISENHKRLFEDSLLFIFDDYLYDKTDVNKTVDNIKKMGADYILVDLNAATIDKDERHALTNRYEEILKTYTSDKLELVETDSVCLKIALEDYKKSKKTEKELETYMSIAGVNYESYDASGKQINRGTKLLACYNKITDLINNNLINQENYPYLQSLYTYVTQNKDKLQDERSLFTLFQQQINAGYKVLFKIK